MPTFSWPPLFHCAVFIRLLCLNNHEAIIFFYATSCRVWLQLVSMRMHNHDLNPHISCKTVYFMQILTATVEKHRRDVVLHPIIDRYSETYIL